MYLMLQRLFQCYNQCVTSKDDQTLRSNLRWTSNSTMFKTQRLYENFLGIDQLQ
jgi:hypothetical protein